MTALSNIYKYHIPVDQIQLKTKVRLEVFHVYEQLHIIIKGDNNNLIWYEILKIQDDTNEDEFKAYFYKLVSITGFIPHDTICITADSEFFFSLNENPKAPLDQISRFISKTISFNKTAEIDSKYSIIYAGDNKVERALSHVFDNVSQIHLVELLISGAKEKVSSIEQFLYVFIMKGKLCLTLYKDNQFSFSVIADWDQPTDVIYHILHCLQINLISVGDIPVITGGFITKDGQLYKELEKYIPELSRLDISTFSFLTSLPELMEEIV